MSKNAADWLKAVEARQKKLSKEWLKSAREAVNIYEMEDKADVPFNILYSNTETLLPALYNSTPRPEVSRRYTTPQTERRLDGAVAQTVERVLEYSADSNDEEYESFDDATRGATLGALVPGLGQVRVRFHEEGKFQNLCYETVQYDRFLWAYARSWKQVPWVAYGHDLNKESFETQFPDFVKKEAYKKVDWKKIEEEANEALPGSGSDADSEKDKQKRQPTLLVWEVWSHEDQEIYFICDLFKDEFIAKDKYPFKLTSRFPSPEPLRFTKRNGCLTPKPLYEFYKRQAEELNELTRRLGKIVKAIKVRGVYDARLNLGDVFKGADNDLQPVESPEFMIEGKGFDAYIWTVPVDELIKTATQLFQARETCKATIYEITGIADILRGSTDPNETAKAQEIKNSWGTLRVKRMQRDVQVFCRNLFRIGAEFSANLYSIATFRSITKLPYLTQNEKQQLQQAQQQAATQQQQYQMAAQQAQQAGQQPPPPPQPPDLGESVAFLEFPSWEEIMQVMRDKFERTYRIDIETNSTIDLEATEDKEAIGEFMNAFGQMTSGLQPMVENGMMPFEAAKAIMSEVFRKFRFGRKVQDALDSMTQPQPKGDADEKHKAEIERIKAESARKVQEMQETLLEMTARLSKTEIENAMLKANLEKASCDMEDMQAAHENEKSLMGREHQLQMGQREFQLKQDHTGKLRQKDDELSGLRGQLQEHQQKMAQMTDVNQLREIMSNVEKMLLKAAQPQGEGNAAVQLPMQGMPQAPIGVPPGGGQVPPG